MTNKEKFKEVFGKELAESLDFDTACSYIPQIVALRSMYIKGVDCIVEWFNTDYDEKESNIGHWEDAGWRGFACSNCKETIYAVCKPKAKYCPNCGAKMKKEIKQ